MGRLAEIRRTLSVLALAAGALFSFVPFLLNLLLSLVLGARVRRRVRGLLSSKGGGPVEDPDPHAIRGRVYVLAGEDSGDLHAGNLVSALKELAPEVEVRGMGGPRMERAGCALDYDLVRLNVMGVLPVLKAVGTFFGLFRDLLRMLETDPPDVLVPVDYPGFNLRVARAARRRGVKVVYYIAPQVWAWAPWRIRRISRCVDRMLVILPFEQELYRDGGIRCSFVGHPLFEHLERVAPSRDPASAAADADATRIGLLPGSRRSEVRTLLPMMLRAARRVQEERPGVSFVLPFRGAALETEIHRILEAEGEGIPVEVVMGRTHETMRDLDLALVASGTATLELAYYQVPMVVLYRVGRLAAMFKRIFLITPHVALVNIVGGRRVVPELIRAGDSSRPAAEALLTWIDDRQERDRCRVELGRVRSRLLTTGVARRSAGFVLGELKSPVGRPPADTACPSPRSHG